MVPKACETPNIGCVQKTSTDECCKCLLAKSVRKPSEPSFLTRVLSSFRLTKTTSENDSSTYSMAIENEDFSENCERESSTECRTCDRKHHLDSNCERDCTEGKPTSMTVNCCRGRSFCSLHETDYGTFLNFTDLEPQDNLAIQIKEVVTTSPDCTRLRITDPTAFKVAKDIIESAEDEPCGLQGCRVIVQLEERGDRIFIGEFNPKEGFICTFEVIVVFQVRTKGIMSYIPFLRCLPKMNFVSDTYSITKDKLYTCSNSRGTTPVHR